MNPKRPMCRPVSVQAPLSQLAVIIGAVRGRSDVVATFTVTRRGLAGPPRIVFAAAESLSDLAWSPDPRWLVAASGSADQWIFLRVGGRAQLFAVGRVAARFVAGPQPARGAPRLGGWQAFAAGW